MGPVRATSCPCTRKVVVTDILDANCRYNLPTPIEQLFIKTPPIKDVYELVLGPENSYYFGYKDSDDKPYCIHSGLPYHLTQWLSPQNGQSHVYYDIPTLSISLGPNESYVVHDKASLAWCGVPDGLAARLLAYGAQGTSLVALGVENSFVVVNTDGSGLRSINGGYAKLEAILSAMPNFQDIHVSEMLLLPDFLSNSTAVMGQILSTLRPLQQ